MIYTQDYKNIASNLNIKIAIINPITFVKSYFMAIIDTGATNTVISKRVFDKLVLQKGDEVEMEGVNGNDVVNLALVNIEIESDMTFPKVEVSVCNLPDWVDALIGLDILTQCDFLLTNVNKTVLQLRSPAIADGVCL